MKEYAKVIYTVFLFLTLAFTIKATEIIPERVYVQTDKSVYLAGEIIWLKMYVTDTEGKPSTLSKIGYIELDDGSSVAAQIKLDVKNGLGLGWMIIPETVASGNYRMISYTRNMQNEGEGIFFEKRLAVINTFKTDEKPLMEAGEVDPIPPVQTGIPNTISLKTDAEVYDERSQGTVELSRLPENIHSLGISIAGNDIVVAGTGTSMAEWKRNIHNRGITPGDTYYTPEYEGHIVLAKLVEVATGQPAATPAVAPMLGAVGDRIRLFGGRQLPDGTVEFYTKRISGTHELATAPYSILKDRYRIDVQTPFFSHTAKQLPPLEIDTLWKTSLQERSLGLQVLSAYMGDSLNRLDEEESFFRREPDWSYLLDEYTRFTRMDEVIIEFIPGLRFRRVNRKRVLSVLMEAKNEFTTGNSLILLDGIPVEDADIIFNYDPLLLRKIDVYRGKFVFGGQSFDGIASFISYNNDYPGLQATNNLQFFDYEGTQPYRHFYYPTYTTAAEKASRIPDYRHTLLWEPEINTQGEREVRIPFTTSGMKGEYLITIEGLTTDGNIIYATKKIYVGRE